MTTDGDRVGAFGGGRRRHCQRRHEGQRRDAAAPARAESGEDPLQRLAQRRPEVAAGPVEPVVAAGHLEEASGRPVISEQRPCLSRRQVAVARRLDDRGRRVDVVRERRVGREGPGRRHGRHSRRSGRFVVALVLRSFDGEILAVGQADRHDAGRRHPIVGLGRRQHGERRATRPARQDRRRVRRDAKRLACAIEDHRVVETQLLGAEACAAWSLDLEEGPRADPDRRLSLGGQGVEHPHRRAEPAAVAAGVEHQRGRRRAGRRRRRRQMQLQ